MRFSVAFALTVVLFAACQGTPVPSDDEFAGRSLTANPSSALEFLNHESVVVDVLVQDVGLSPESAAALLGTRPFSTLSEVERILDPGQLDRLAGWLAVNGWVDSPHTAPEVDFTAGEAELTLILANEASYEFLRDIVELRAAVAEAIINARSFDSVAAIAAVESVDADALARLRHAACLYVD